MMVYRVGVDIGGTFTDIVIYDTVEFRVVKVLTRLTNVVDGVIDGLRKVNIDPREVKIIIHATTLGTNLFLGQERLYKPKIALITTRGFRDIIEIGRQIRPELYNLFFEKPKPLISRMDRFEVDERIDSKGNIIRFLDRDRLVELSRVISGYDGVVIAFINSHINPINEVRAKEVISSLYPNIDITLSSEINPVEGEYERFSTAILNALLRPILSNYLRKFRSGMNSVGFNGIIYVMQSSGGIAPLDLAIKTPVLFIESGPAAGAVATAYYSHIIGDKDVVGFDMGGTTAKASTIINNEPLITTEYEVGGKMHYGRLLRGSGYPVNLPYIDLVEVSAGGGTVAWVDKGGALRVGPVSAGSNPGPACYGLGGDKPTVTDANFILGRLGDVLAGGEVKLNRDLAYKALSALSDSLGMDIIEVAYGIIKIVNSLMSKAIRIVTLERGVDPKSMKLYAFGGAGPLHATELIKDIGIKEVLVPSHPGTFSAMGLLLSDYRIDKVRAILETVDDVRDDYLQGLFMELEEEVYRDLKFTDKNRIVVFRYLDLRYKGQLDSIRVLWKGDLMSSVKDFYNKYLKKYGFISYEDIVEIANIRVTVNYLVDKPKLKRYPMTHYDAKPNNFREVFFDGEWFKTGVYNRETLKAGAKIYGPAIIEEYDSTTLIPPDFVASIDEYLNIRIRGV